MANPSEAIIQCPQSPSELDGKSKAGFNGNEIFSGSYQHSPPPTGSEAPRAAVDPDQSAAYQRFKEYQDRTRRRHSTSPELSRRYFSDLEGSTPQAASAEESTFTGHLAMRTSQLDRMDLNTVTGKNSLFLANRDEDPTDVTDVMYENAIRTDAGTKLLLPFTKESFLGEGRHSKVYKGTIWKKEVASWQDVAVKLGVHEADGTESLMHEMKALQSIACPYIVSVMDTLKIRGKWSSVYVLGYVMSLAEFGTLESFLLAKDVFSLSLLQFMSWSRQVLLAVKALRDVGITHFDIKPHNILVMKDYTLRLGDFGEALCEPSPDYQETRGRGTLHYMAPELLCLDREGPCDGGAVDMYSAGLVMYSLITGRLPWMDIRGPATHQLLTCKKGFWTGSYNPMPVVDTHDQFKLPGPSGEVLEASIVRGMSMLVRGCTALDPRHRFSVDVALTHLDSLIVS